MQKLRVLLADDHETVRTGLRVILSAQADMEVVAEASDGASAIAAATAVRPDVVVLDISMPHGNGLKTAATLQERLPDVKVVVLTRHAEEGYVQQLLKAGVRAYVLKQSQTDEVLRAIRAAATGGIYIDPKIAAKVLGSVARPRTLPRSGAPALSAREEEVLKLMAWGYSNKEIAARLDLSVKTIESHRAKAMQKLGVANRIDIVRYALLQGWLEDG